MHRKLKRFMRGRLAAAAVAGIALLAAGSAAAHHALDAMYDTNTEIETTATLLKVDWINPHAWMRFDIRSKTGTVERNVLVETVGIAGLRQLGISRDALVIGATYEIIYNPPRDGSAGGFMTRLTKTDGTLLGEPAYEPDGGDCACQHPL